MQKLFKRKKLNYKKVGYTHAFVLKEIFIYSNSKFYVYRGFVSW